MNTINSTIARKTFIKAFKTAPALFLFTFLFIAAFASQMPAQVKSSKIIFVETNHNFGNVAAGTQLTYKYKFQNNGKDTLVIKNVRASCGCTGATIGEKKKFDAGEYGEIKVTFNTTGRTGHQSKTVSVQSNDPEKPNVILLFTCEIVSK